MDFIAGRRGGAAFIGAWVSGVIALLCWPPPLLGGREAPPTIVLSDATVDWGLARNGEPPQLGAHGVAFADVDENGYPDLFISVSNVPGAANLFFRNSGDAFVDGTEAAGFLRPDGGSHGVCWADLDNDGDFDLLDGRTHVGAPNQPGANSIFVNRDAAEFRRTVPVALGQRRESTRGIVAFDADSDDDLDLFAVTDYLGSNDPAEQRNELYFNNGQLRFRGIENGAAYDAPAGQGVVSTDFDMDGDVDLIAGNRTGKMNILRNEGDGTFSRIDPEVVGIRHPAGDGISSGDVDNDGDTDLLLATAQGSAVLYLNDGQGSFVVAQEFHSGFGAGSQPENGKCAAGFSFMGGFADLDNDGDLDLVLPGAYRIYLNDGTGSFVIGRCLPTPPPVDPRAIAFADIDRDGDLDFVIAPKRSSPRLFRNDTRGSHWLAVELVSPRGQIGAFGAKVWVYTARGQHLLGFREAGCAEGYLAQDDPVLHFGLGDHERVRLVVAFLDGTRVEVDAVAADRVIQVDGRTIEIDGSRGNSVSLAAR